MNKSTLTCAQLALAGITALAGCSHSGATTPQPAASQGDEATPAETSKFSDGQIVGILAAVDGGETQQAQVAATKATDAQVKQFAAHMIDQHTADKQKIAEIASQANIVPSDSPTSKDLGAKGADMLSTLNSVDTANFDDTYMKGQIKQHQEVLDLLNSKLIPAAQNAALHEQLMAAKTMVESHLSMAQQIEPTLKH